VLVPRIYVDTSVIGGYFDPEFADKTARLFDDFRHGRARLVISDLTLRELEPAPEHVRVLVDEFPKETIRTTAESLELATQYIAAGAVREASRADAEHISLATIARVDVVVSWNFRHIVNLPRIRRYNAVNLASGYPQIDIRTPIEVTGP